MTDEVIKKERYSGGASANRRAGGKPVDVFQQANTSCENICQSISVRAMVKKTMSDPGILKAVGQVAGIGGLALGVFLLLFRSLIQKWVIQYLTKKQAHSLLVLFMCLTFAIALSGIAAWAYSKHLEKSQVDHEKNELIALLNQRADSIVENMHRENEERVRYFKSHPEDFCDRYRSESELRHDQEVTEKLFLKLHQQDVQAIKDGQLIVAHQIVAQIHDLLFLRKSHFDCHWFEEESRVSYFVSPIRHDPYPYADPCDLTKGHTPKVTLTNWIANVQIGIETEADRCVEDVPGKQEDSLKKVEQQLETQPR